LAALRGRKKYGGIAGIASSPPSIAKHSKGLWHLTLPSHTITHKIIINSNRKRTGKETQMGLALPDNFIATISNSRHFKILSSFMLGRLLYSLQCRLLATKSLGQMQAMIKRKSHI